jgi:hypothetical protein
VEFVERVVGGDRFGGASCPDGGGGGGGLGIVVVIDGAGGTSRWYIVGFVVIVGGCWGFVERIFKCKTSVLRFFWFFLTWRGQKTGVVAAATGKESYRRGRWSARATSRASS